MFSDQENTSSINSLIERTILFKASEPKLYYSFSELDNFLRREIYPIIDELPLSGIHQFITRLSLLINRYKELSHYPDLMSKRLIAFGGGFSAGKSSLINTLLNHPILRTAVHPTTAIPTYIYKGHDNFSGINLFLQKIEFSRDDFNKLVYDESEKVNGSLAELYQSVSIQKSDMFWDNIALIDTPGYSKPEDVNWSGRTDQQIALTQLNYSDLVVWAVSIESGTLSDDDIHFLHSLNKGKQIILVLTKADKVTEENVYKVVNHIKNMIKSLTLNIIDVIPVSRRNNLFSSLRLKQILSEQDATQGSDSLLSNIFTLFEEIKERIRKLNFNHDEFISSINQLLTSFQDDNLISMLDNYKIEKLSKYKEVNSQFASIEIIENKVVDKLLGISNNDKYNFIKNSHNYKFVRSCIINPIVADNRINYEELSCYIKSQIISRVILNPKYRYILFRINFKDSMDINNKPSEDIYFCYEDENLTSFNDLDNLITNLRLFTDYEGSWNILQYESSMGNEGWMIENCNFIGNSIYSLGMNAISIEELNGMEIYEYN